MLLIRRLWPYGHNIPFCRMGEEAMAKWPYDNVEAFPLPAPRQSPAPSASTATTRPRTTGTWSQRRRAPFPLPAHATRPRTTGTRSQRRRAPFPLPAPRQSPAPSASTADGFFRIYQSSNPERDSSENIEKIPIYLLTYYARLECNFATTFAF